jgi:hypothetical protein
MNLSFSTKLLGKTKEKDEELNESERGYSFKLGGMGRNISKKMSSAASALGMGDDHDESSKPIDAAERAAATSRIMLLMEDFRYSLCVYTNDYLM